MVPVGDPTDRATHVAKDRQDHEHDHRRHPHPRGAGRAGRLAVRRAVRARRENRHHRCRELPATGEAGGHAVCGVGPAQSGRGDQPAHGQDARALHQVGPAPAGHVGPARHAGRTRAGWCGPGRPAGHAEPALRADRRVLPHPADAEKLLLLVRQRVLPPRVRAGPGQGPADGRYEDRADPRADAGEGLAGRRGRPVATAPAAAHRPGTAAGEGAGTDRPVVPGVRAADPRLGRDRLLPGRHRAGRKRRPPPPPIWAGSRSPASGW